MGHEVKLRTQVMEYKIINFVYSANDSVHIPSDLSQGNVMVQQGNELQNM